MFKVSKAIGVHFIKVFIYEFFFIAISHSPTLDMEFFKFKKK